MTTAQQPPSNAMAIIDTRQAPIATAHFGADRVAMVVEQLSRGWKRPMTLAELEHIGLVCERTRLDPLVKPTLIWFIQRWDKNAGGFVMTAQTSIDGLRLIASRSRDYVTQVGPQWCGPDGNWQDIWTSTNPPAAARVGVVRRGAREPLWSVALWQESVQNTAFWDSRPAHMLAKTAEGNALKRACPAETNELELAHLEEMERLEVPARAAEYVRIHGSNDEAFGLAGNPALPPAEYRPPRERTDLEDLPPPVVPLPLTPERQRLIDVYATLVGQALELGVLVGSAMDWIRAAAGTDDQIIAKGRALRELVNKAAAAKLERDATTTSAPPPAAESPGSEGASPPSDPPGTRRYEDVFDEPEAPTADELTAPRDPETGEVLDGAPPKDKPKIAAWAENRELTKRATELGLQGIPVINNRSSLDVVAQANAVLSERIRNHELDLQLVKQQEAHF